MLTGGGRIDSTSLGPPEGASTVGSVWHDRKRQPNVRCVIFLSYQSVTKKAEQCVANL